MQGSLDGVAVSVVEGMGMIKNRNRLIGVLNEEELEGGKLDIRYISSRRQVGTSYTEILPPASEDSDKPSPT
jgi:hypothetical protein